MTQNSEVEVKKDGVIPELQPREVTPKDLMIDDLTRQVAQKALELADARAQLVMTEFQMSQWKLRYQKVVGSHQALITKITEAGYADELLESEPEPEADSKEEEDSEGMTENDFAE